MATTTGAPVERPGPLELRRMLARSVDEAVMDFMEGVFGDDPDELGRELLLKWADSERLYLTSRFAELENTLLVAWAETQAPGQVVSA